MNFQKQLENWQANELSRNSPQSKIDPPPSPAVEKPAAPQIRPRTNHAVLGSGISREPVDRAAAMLVAKAPWYAHPPSQPLKVTSTQKSPQQPKRKIMQAIKTHADMPAQADNGLIPNQTATTKAGFKIYREGGKDMFKISEIEEYLCREVPRLVNETRPNVQAAEDARKIIGELLLGIGGEMEKFKADIKLYLQDIRSVRSAIVVETSQITGPLKEIRQFFHGSDYREEVTRLKEFVELCERLQKLKESGFLDNIADTMLRLA